MFAVIVTVVVAELLPGVGSGVLLPAVVVSVTVPLVAGVNVVVHEIAAFTARLATGGVGLQFVVAPTGAPLTAQLAAVATFGPLLTQLVVTLIGVPAGVVWGPAPVAFISAEALLVIVQVITSATSVTVI